MGWYILARSKRPMDIWARIGQTLPMCSAGAQIASCRTALAEKGGAELAFAHLRLYKIYTKKAAELPFFLSVPFRRLGEHHLDQAIESSELLAEPLAIRAISELRDGELRDGLRDLEKAVVRQQLLMQIPSSKGDTERVRLCRYLYVAGEVQYQLGCFQKARELLEQASQEFRLVSANLRGDESKLEEGILLGIVCCLQFETKY